MTIRSYLLFRFNEILFISCFFIIILGNCASWLNQCPLVNECQDEKVKNADEYGEWKLFVFFFVLDIWLHVQTKTKAKNGNSNNNCLLCYSFESVNWTKVWVIDRRFFAYGSWTKIKIDKCVGDGFYHFLQNKKKIKRANWNRAKKKKPTTNDLQMEITIEVSLIHFFFIYFLFISTINETNKWNNSLFFYSLFQLQTDQQNTIHFPSYLQ